MPRKNTRKPRRWRGWYHVYNRQRDRAPMFIDKEDRRYFMGLFKRYLSEVEHHDSRGRPYKRLRGNVRLISFALMGNHFHLILLQLVPGGIEDLMDRVMKTYVKYFNSRHGDTGAMFSGEYRAAPKLDRRAQLNAIAYVHDNHGDDCRCEFCGHRYFVGSVEEAPSWLDPSRGLALFGGEASYRNYRRSRHIQRDVVG